MHYDSEICQKAYDQLYNDSEKILQLIKVQMDNLTMTSYQLYEEVIDTHMFDLLKELDFLVKMIHIIFMLLFVYIIFCFIGLVMVYSASMVAATKGSLTGGVPVAGNYFFIRQLMYCIVGFGIVFFMSYFMHINILKNKRVQQIMIFSVFGLLVLTLLIGTEINGSTSWINLGFMNLQAS